MSLPHIGADKRPEHARRRPSYSHCHKWFILRRKQSRMFWPPDGMPWPPTGMVWPLPGMLWPPSRTAWPPAGMLWPLTGLAWPPTRMRWPVPCFGSPLVGVSWPPLDLSWPLVRLARPLAGMSWPEQRKKRPRPFFLPKSPVSGHFPTWQRCAIPHSTIRSTSRRNNFFPRTIISA